MTVGIIGGTGPLGAGLAARLAVAGTPVVIGSREAHKAIEVVDALKERWASRELDIRGAANDEAAHCEIVVVSTPWEVAVQTVTPFSNDLAGKLVVSVGNALVRQGREFQAIVPPRGSVAAWLQGAIPRSRVAAACHHLPARLLQELDVEIDSDVLVCSDEKAAAEETVAMLAVIEGIRPIYTGSLASASAVEAFTAVLATLNVRHKAHATLKIAGLEILSKP
jgi:NADPH-dependent F420 reductase